MCNLNSLASSISKCIQNKVLLTLYKITATYVEDVKAKKVIVAGFIIEAFTYLPSDDQIQFMNLISSHIPLDTRSTKIIIDYLKGEKEYMPKFEILLECFPDLLEQVNHNDMVIAALSGKRKLLDIAKYFFKHGQVCLNQIHGKIMNFLFQQPDLICYMVSEDINSQVIEGFVSTKRLDIIKELLQYNFVDLGFSLRKKGGNTTVIGPILLDGDYDYMVHVLDSYPGFSENVFKNKSVLEFLIMKPFIVDYRHKMEYFINTKITIPDNILDCFLNYPKIRKTLEREDYMDLLILLLQKGCDPSYKKGNTKPILENILTSSRNDILEICVQYATDLKIVKDQSKLAKYISNSYFNKEIPGYWKEKMDDELEMYVYAYDLKSIFSKNAVKGMNQDEKVSKIEELIGILGQNTVDIEIGGEKLIMLLFRCANGKWKKEILAHWIPIIFQISGLKYDDILDLKCKESVSLFQYINNPLFHNFLDSIRDEEGVCPIIGDHMPLTYNNTCGHSYGIETIRSWIEVEIDRNSEQIKCPYQECDTEFNMKQISSYIDVELYGAYCTKLSETAILADPSIITCSSCGASSWKSMEQFCGRCHNCESHFCGICWNEFHTNSCAQNLLEKISNPETKGNIIWKSKNSKKCPKCQTNIEKNGGCSHITCYICQYQFCWICGRLYQSGNYVYSEECNCADSSDDMYFHRIPLLWGYQTRGWKEFALREIPEGVDRDEYFSEVQQCPIS
eukprot:TRINITY_DN8115_c0_g1_i1.p1 TRINITY_DN8115_c0_g1~~TRINITY_DN8115_c0_g1_i1.p1  ORF type:complete len:823 (-),score=138.17 TRINITY_DN8115_c0_g1_i1:44-2248(-)